MNIWYFSDNKPGHENQILGLIDQLKYHVTIQADRINCADYPHAFTSWLLKRHPKEINYATPSLIIGAGHRTHWPVIAASRITGAKSLILMTPSLPLWMFDYVVAPEHDHLAPNSKRFISMGALNRMKAATKQADLGLILLGGESKHFIWDDKSIIQQIHHLVTKTPHIKWKITTSRRTPKSFCHQLENLLENLKEEFYQIDELVFADQCPKGWLQQQMSCASISWSTPDSVNMIYESLTANCWVGIFSLDSKNTSVSDSILSMIDKQKINSFSYDSVAYQGATQEQMFNEAERCARWLMASLPKEVICD